ncbi:MAG: signal peptidase I [Rubrobacteraceae bacterium]
MSEERRSGKSQLRGHVEFLLMLAVSLALVFGFVRPVVAAPVFIDSGSMIPTLQISERLLINKLADDFSEPERGDIVLFEDPAGGEAPLIKRTVGLPGETVEFRGGDLFINGSPVEEPYINDPAPDTAFAPATNFGPVEVPEGRYFVMGDNRGGSLDSRSFGPIPEESLIGEALFSFWPPGRAGAV